MNAFAVWLDRYILPAAYAVLPATMQSNRASALLLAIALQESKLVHRRQVKGPARGFWQFEEIGVEEVRRNPASRSSYQEALAALRYRQEATTAALHVAIEHNDVLACVTARLALWRHPDELPRATEPVRAWGQYQTIWAPGRPHPETWAGHYSTAWDLKVREPGTLEAD
jgi:hypothetical protein